LQILIEIIINDRKGNMSNKLVQNCFEKQAMITPEYIAIQYHDEKWTYQTLDYTANQLAHYLQEFNHPRESPIPILINNPIHYVISILAILKCGHYYVPLPSSTPTDRLQLILEQLECPFLLSDLLNQTKINTCQKNVLIVSELLPMLKHYPTHQLSIDTSSHSLAYMIFTSGSTGAPKGVLMEHRGPVNIIAHMCDMSSLNEKEFFIQNVNFGFDPHVWTLFWPLSVGATVILQNEQEQHDVENLLRLINQYQIRVLHAGVSLTKGLLKLPNISQCKSLQQIIGGGEAWPVYTFNELIEKLPHCELVNVYGPTETCIHVTFWRSSSSKEIPETIPIGKAVANYKIYILDEHLNEVPNGDKGQIYISGIGLARGYYKDKHQTEKKFVPNHFTDNENSYLYQSGDYGRMNADGNIEFLGRLDEQVQIRGHRVEIGEIESLLNQYQNITNGIVLATKKDTTPEIIAFVSPKEITDNTKLIMEISSFLQQKLPNYMLPKKIFVIHEWPLTSNGKINKNQLIELIAQDNLQTDLIEDYGIKEILTKIWCKILDLTQIEEKDDFFQIGGDSLNALDIIANINHQFKADFSVSIIFDNPTLEALVSYITANQTARKPPPIKREHKSVFNLSLNQKRLLRLSLENPSLNNGIIPLKVSGQINVEALKNAAKQLIEEHEILRANIAKHDQNQMVISDIPNEKFFTTINFLERANFSPTLPVVEIITKEYLDYMIDVSEEPLFQIKVIQYGTNEHLILIYLNHLIADSFTGNFIVDNVVANYQAITMKQAPLNFIKINHFQNYVLAEEAFYTSTLFQDQFNFWHQLLLHQPRILHLVSHEITDLASGFTFCRITEEIATALRNIAAKNKISLFSTLLTLIAKTLFDYSKQNKFVIGFTSSQRDKIEFQNMLGPLSNKLLMPVDFTTVHGIIPLLEQINHTLLKIYKNSNIQLEILRDSFIQLEGESYTELFNILFDYEKESKKYWKIDDKTMISSLPMPESSQVKRYLSIRVADDDETLIFNIRYRKAIFSDDKIEQLKELLNNNIKLLISSVSTIQEAQPC
jgi:amino acid adenylation domain-containing protein